MEMKEGYSRDRLDVVVEALKAFLANDDIRVLGQRAVQGKAWHRVPAVADYLSDLRCLEEALRGDIMARLSALIFRFHDYTLDATLARAGLMNDARVHAGSSLDKKTEFDLFCLDSKERLYMILKQYGWLTDFFRLYPQHFYENSFRFVDLIPPKKLPIKVKVLGLGIGGSLAVSGLAKCGIDSVHGYEQRERSGLGGVDSRYQNASWRAYDIAEKLLDKDAFEMLCRYRQRLNVSYDDGSSRVVTTDRVQIIIGNAIDGALKSAVRYGALLHFGHSSSLETESEPADIVALFCGAHTSTLSPLLEEEMQMNCWPEDISSSCKMWLRLRESHQTEAYCTRGGELGAEKWHYTINSSRDEVQDIQRVRAALIHQYRASSCSEEDINDLPDEYHQKLSQIDKVLRHVEASISSATGLNRYDYEFTNAPDNEHNRAKRKEAGKDGTVVLDGEYKVDIKLASRSVIGNGEASQSANTSALLQQFGAKLIVTGGDACVPPNPLAAYGATLACEAADMLVHLAVAHGHLNAILSGLEDSCLSSFVSAEWIQDVKQVKTAIAEYYDVRGRSENYFQWIQTLICNLYSLPPINVEQR